MSKHIGDANKMVPLSATLARLDDLRERASCGEWHTHQFDNDPPEIYADYPPGLGWVATARRSEIDADLIALEHNTGPARDAMLERAREVIREYRGGIRAHDLADEWLAEYEGASDA